MGDDHADTRAAAGASAVIRAASWQHAHNDDRELAVVAFKPYAPVADAQAVVARSAQSLDVAGQLGAVGEPLDGAQDPRADRWVDAPQILAGAVVNNDAPVRLAHA